MTTGSRTTPNAKINWAGRVLTNDQSPWDDLVDAYLVVNEWRSDHAYAINTFQATLRNKLKSIDPTALVAQRLKRLPSIESKLKRFPSMQLFRMQDIGGLRAVVTDIAALTMLQRSYEKSRFAHRLVSFKDYVEHPKESGYRGIHLVYRYESKLDPRYNGLQIELQLRTRIQHAWATAVETSSLFLDSPLKSSEGPREWLEFFELAASCFAFLERRKPAPQHAEYFDEYIERRMLAEAARLKIREKLSAFTVAARAIQTPRAKKHYYLVSLDTATRIIHLRAYEKNQLELASRDYLAEEEKVRSGSALQVVLVVADSVSALKKAYPNYFLDTHTFISLLERVERRLYKRWDPRQMALPLGRIVRTV
jgi:ppGpp synthetase/RelA/SpoT-type nucleotidyltranferase